MILTVTLAVIGLGALGDPGGIRLAGRAHAAGDRALGEYLAAECATCHQASGRQQGGIPAIVGHPSAQFVALMGAYKDRQRDNQVMQTIAGRLSREEIEALAAYYESLKPPGRPRAADDTHAHDDGTTAARTPGP